VKGLQHPLSHVVTAETNILQNPVIHFDQSRIFAVIVRVFLAGYQFRTKGA